MAAQTQPVRQPEESTVFGSMLGDYYMRILMGPYDRPKPFDTEVWAPKTAVFLPLPAELRDDTGVNWGNVDLNSVGDLINGDPVAGAGAALLRNSGKLAGGLATAAAGAVAGTGGSALLGAAAGNFAADAAENTVESLFPPDQVTSAFQQMSGLAPNPNPSVAFQGPQLREFSYSWTLFAKNKAESRNIQNLVKTLKMRALPENKVSDASAILMYPWMCQLNFFPWDRGGSGRWFWSDNSIIKIKKCVIASVNANYTPSNIPAFFHDTKSPVAVQISINFKEIEYMMSADWGGTAGKGLIEMAGDALGGANTVNAIQNTLLTNPATMPLGLGMMGARALIDAVL